VKCLRRFGRQPASEIVDRILAEAEACGATDDMTAVVLSAV
jgi:hypothetical protein